MRKIAIYQSLISYLVPELQGFKDTKKCGHEQENQLKFIKINQN